MQDILSKQLQLFKLDIELPNDASRSLIAKKMHDELVLQNMLIDNDPRAQRATLAGQKLGSSVRMRRRNGPKKQKWQN